MDELLKDTIKKFTHQIRELEEKHQEDITQQNTKMTKKERELQEEMQKIREELAQEHKKSIYSV